MKNNILLLALFALLISQTNFLTAQTVGTVKTSTPVVTVQTPQQKKAATMAMETITRSKKDNALMGIKNPNKIQIGDKLAFRFENTGVVYHIVDSGENQYSILYAMFTKHPNENLVSATSNNGVVTEQAQTKGLQPYASNVVSDFLTQLVFGLPLFAWVGFALIALIVFLKLYSDHKKEKATRLEKERIENDPTLAGPPVYGNGITDGNAVEVMTNAVTTIHPDLAQFPIKILKMEKGTINSETAEVYFGGQRSKKSMIINNVRGVRATVIIGDEQEQRIVYALQACGNPLKDGDFVIGRKIQFTPDTLGAVIQIPQVEVVVEKPEEKGNQVAEALLKAIAAGERTGNATIQFTMLPTGHCSLNVVFTRLMLPPHMPVKESETTAEVSSN